MGKTPMTAVRGHQRRRASLGGLHGPGQPTGRRQQPSSVGFANYALYAIGQSANYGSDFHDINDKSNNNDQGNDPVSFIAVTGYDLATGWGSPNGQSLINDLTGSAFRSTPTPTPSTGGCGTVSSAKLQLEEFTSLNGSQASESFEVINTGTTPLNLSDITIKFWVDDTTGYSLLGAVNYGGCFGANCTSVNGVTLTASNFSPACEADPTHQANWELTLSNTSTATLAAGQTWVNAQTAIHLADFAAFSSPASWYSPSSVGAGAYTNDPHFAVYYQGSPVTASGGSAPSCRLTCTPTFTFTPTNTPTPTFTISLTPTATICACQISQAVTGFFNGTNFDLAIDPANGVLYVPNAGTSQVLEVNLNGGNNMTLASGSVTGIFGPSGLAYSGGFLYVGERLQWEKINPVTNAHVNTIVVPNLSTIPSVSVASNGDVYLAAQLTTGDAIQVYQPSGNSYVLATSNLVGISELTSVMISGNTLYAGYLISGTSSSILQYTLLSETAGSVSFSAPTTLAGPSVLGSLVEGPSQLVLDSTGTHLYAGGGLGPLSVLNLSSGTLAYQCDNLGWAMGVGFDASGNVYVSDGAHGQVDRMVNCGTPVATATVTRTSTPALTPTKTNTQTLPRPSKRRALQPARPPCRRHRRLQRRPTSQGPLRRHRPPRVLERLPLGRTPRR